MSNKKGGLDFSAVFIDNAMFTVLDLPDTVSIEEEGPDVFRLNNAYRINTDMTKGIFPYRGVIKKGTKWGHRSGKPGIYLKKDEYDRFVDLKDPATYLPYDTFGACIMDLVPIIK